MNSQPCTDTLDLFNSEPPEPQQPPQATAAAVSDQHEQANAFARQLAGKAIKQGYKPTHLHVYTDALGQPLYWKTRAKHPTFDSLTPEQQKATATAAGANGSKWIRAFHHDGAAFVAKEPAFTGGKPLYRLHELVNADAGQAVYICEGEQKADFLASLGLIATTSGGKSSANATDWQPIAARKVIVWPDFDDAGQSYQSDVATVLSGLGCELWAVDVALLDLPHKGDVIDWQQQRTNSGMTTTAADVMALPMVKIEPLKTEPTPEIQALDSAAADTADAIQIIEAALSQAATDIGLLWENVTLDAMRHVYDHNKPQWARLRLRLKQCKGLKLSDYEREIVPASDGNSPEINTAATLIAIAEQDCSFCHDADSEPYALIQADSIRQCYHVNSKAYAEWLSYRFYKSEGTAPNDNALKSALSTLAGKAKFEGDQVEVNIRIARHDGAYWLDLCNDQWQAVRIAANDWQVINQPPVIFTRTSSMRPLPTPIAGEGNLSALWQMANIPEADHLIIVAWLLECLRPETPFVVLELSGEQGSAKSSTQSALRDLIDPNRSNLRTAPKQKDDVFISARNSHMVSFENLSHLSADYQDALCSLATGAGYATRTLYTTTDETTIELKKPIVLNGIATVVTAHDLLDRTLHIDLPMLQSVSTEAALGDYWQANHAAAFTGLLDTFSRVLAKLDTVDLSGEQLPRMADFTILGEAVYIAHGQPPKAFLHDYRERRKEGVNRTLESSPVAMAAMAYLEQHPSGFSGLVGDLLHELEHYRDDGDAWPKSAKGFSDLIQRLKPSFRQIGIDLHKENTRTKRGYLCHLKKTEGIYVLASKTLKQSTPSTPHTPEVHPQPQKAEKTTPSGVRGVHGVLHFDDFDRQDIYTPKNDELTNHDKNTQNPPTDSRHFGQSVQSTPSTPTAKQGEMEL